MYPWGTDAISPTLANYNESNKNGTTPVGSYGTNGYGLYDMAGNVWEWCWDWYGDYAQIAKTDPRGASSGSSRVFRGGSWADGTDYVRSSYRYYYPPDGTGNNIGFRVARAP